MNSLVDELMGTYMCSRAEATAMLKLRAKIAACDDDRRRHHMQRSLWKMQDRLMLRSILSGPMRWVEFKLEA